MKTTVTPEMYRRLAESIIDVTDNRVSWHGAIFDDEHEEWGFSGYLLMYYRMVDYPEGINKELSKIEAIVYEFDTYDEKGNETENDFSFEELKTYLF